MQCTFTSTRKTKNPAHHFDIMISWYHFSFLKIKDNIKRKASSDAFLLWVTFLICTIKFNHYNIRYLFICEYGLNLFAKTYKKFCFARYGAFLHSRREIGKMCPHWTNGARSCMWYSERWHLFKTKDNIKRKVSKFDTFLH